MGEEKFLGVEKTLLEEFLVLLRDKYKIADAANYFLESRAGISGSNVAVANQRDTLSHLVSFLSDPEQKTEQDRRDQIAAAGEHLRRSVIESYQYAVHDNMGKLSELVDEYKKTVLLSSRELKGAPTYEAIKIRKSAITKLAEEGRNAKARNVWDEQWEEGVKKLIKAYEETDRLIDELEKYHLRAEQISQNKKNSRLAYTGIILSVLFGISGVLFGISGWFSDELKQIFKWQGTSMEEPETQTMQHEPGD